MSISRLWLKYAHFAKSSLVGKSIQATGFCEIIGYVFLEEAPARTALQKLLTTEGIHFIYIGFAVDEFPLLFSRCRSSFVVGMLSKSAFEVGRIADISLIVGFVLNDVDVVHSETVYQA